MSPPRRGIGRGLEAILAVSPGGSEGAEEQLRELPTELISPNPRQPRKRFDEQALAALAGSLGERGMLQPVLGARPQPGGRYELIAGERRWRAAQLADLPSVPALVRSGATTERRSSSADREHGARGYHPIEEARPACAALVEELGLTREDVGRRVGRGRVAVSNLIRLLDLPEEAIELVAEGALSEGHGRALLLAEDHGARRGLARSAVHEGWSVRTLEGRARESNADQRKSSARPGRVTRHPDQEQAARELAEDPGSND